MGRGGHLWGTPTRPLGVKLQALRLKPASGATLGAVGAAGKYLHRRLLVCLPQGAGSSFLQGMLEGDFKKSELKAHEGDMHQRAVTEPEVPLRAPPQPSP